MVCFEYNRRLRDRCYNTTPTFFREYYFRVTIDTVHFEVDQMYYDMRISLR